MSCTHVRLDHVLPGWSCCGCGMYNGYQRDACRACGHPPCYETESEEGRKIAKFLEEERRNPDPEARGTEGRRVALFVESLMRGAAS